MIWSGNGPKIGVLCMTRSSCGNWGMGVQNLQIVHKELTQIQKVCSFNQNNKMFVKQGGLSVSFLILSHSFLYELECKLQ